jgi:hypothetical protein
MTTDGTRQVGDDVEYKRCDTARPSISRLTAAMPAPGSVARYAKSARPAIGSPDDGTPADNDNTGA